LEQLVDRSEYESSDIRRSIFKRVIEWHNGTTTTKSCLGKGATIITAL